MDKICSEAETAVIFAIEEVLFDYYGTNIRSDEARAMALDILLKLQSAEIANKALDALKQPSP